VADIASGDRNALVGGPFGSDLVSRDYVESGVPVIRGANMGKGRWVSGDFVFVTPEKADSLSANCAKPGDLVFTQRGTIGQVALVPDNEADRYLISQSQMKLSVDPTKADALFLFYVFSSEEHQNYIQQNAIRTGVPHTNLSILRTTPLRMPELDEQKAIAKVLSTLDAKIELNQRMNEELEGMAKLLYDYWFVQYDFPMSAAHAAALGMPHLTGHPYRASGGPMTYHQTLKREIPKGWEVGNIFSVSDVGGGATPSKKAPEFWGGEVPFFTPTDARSETFCMDTEDHLSPIGIKNKATRLYPKGTVFITARGSVGKAMIISKEMAMNQSCYALCPHPGIGSAFLYFHTLSLMDHLRLKSSGSVFDSIVTNDLSFTPAIAPSAEAITAFGQIVEPMFESILVNQIQTRELTTLRDWLLPMLMNGQVKVS